MKLDAIWLKLRNCATFEMLKSLEYFFLKSQHCLLASFWAYDLIKRPTYKQDIGDDSDSGFVKKPSPTSLHLRRQLNLHKF